jgi:hypothetical protein
MGKIKDAVKHLTIYQISHNTNDQGPNATSNELEKLCPHSYQPESLISKD